MKNILKTLIILTLLLIVSAFITSNNSKYEIIKKKIYKDYVVTHSGDTIYGKIKLNSEYKAKFKANGESRFKKINTKTYFSFTKIKRNEPLHFHTIYTSINKYNKLGGPLQIEN
jgi:hypothetical protein